MVIQEGLDRNGKTVQVHRYCGSNRVVVYYVETVGVRRDGWCRPTLEPVLPYLSRAKKAFGRRTRVASGRHQAVIGFVISESPRK